MTIIQAAILGILYLLYCGEIFVPWTYCFIDLMLVSLLTGLVLGYILSRHHTHHKQTQNTEKRDYFLHGIVSQNGCRRLTSQFITCVVHKPAFQDQDHI